MADVGFRVDQSALRIATLKITKTPLGYHSKTTHNTYHNIVICTIKLSVLYAHSYCSQEQQSLCNTSPSVTEHGPFLSLLPINRPDQSGTLAKMQWTEEWNVGSYLRSLCGSGGCCWRVMKVVPHTGLLWLFLSQPIGGDDGYGVLRNPWSDSVSAVREEAELPITTATTFSVYWGSHPLNPQSAWDRE